MLDHKHPQKKSRVLKKTVSVISMLILKFSDLKLGSDADASPSCGSSCLACMMRECLGNRTAWDVKLLIRLHCAFIKSSRKTSSFRSDVRPLRALTFVICWSPEDRSLLRTRIPDQHNTIYPNPEGLLRRSAVQSIKGYMLYCTNYFGLHPDDFQSQGRPPALGRSHRGVGRSDMHGMPAPLGFKL